MHSVPGTGPWSVFESIGKLDEEMTRFGFESCLIGQQALVAAAHVDGCLPVEPVTIKDGTAPGALLLLHRFGIQIRISANVTVLADQAQEYSR